MRFNGAWRRIDVEKPMSSVNASVVIIAKFINHGLLYAYITDPS